MMIKHKVHSQAWKDKEIYLFQECPPIEENREREVETLCTKNRKTTQRIYSLSGNKQR